MPVSFEATAPESTEETVEERLRKLEQLLDSGVISPDEYRQRKIEALEAL